MKTPFTLLTLAAALAVSAAGPEGLVSKSATGTTAARVNFEAGDRGFSLLTADATSDKAASVFSWRAGTTPYTVAVAGAGSVTSLVFFATGSTLTTNDIVLTSPTNGIVTNLQVHSRLFTTNTIVTLAQPLATNLAVGDTIKERLTNNYVLTVTHAIGATNAWIDRTNGLVAADLVLLEAPGIANTNTIHTVTVQTNRQYRLTADVPFEQGTNAVIYNALTNSARVTAAVTATGTNIPVATINGFTNGHVILIRNAAGQESVRTIHAVTTTNIAILSTNGFTLTTNDMVFRLTNGVPVRFPARINSRIVEAAATNSLSTNTVVITSTGNPPFIARLESYVTNVLRYPVAFTQTNRFAILEGFAFGKLTNTHTLRLADATNDVDVMVDSATTLAIGDRIALIPSGGGVVVNTVRAITTNQVLVTVNFTGTIGSAATVGDNVYLANTAVTSPVGAATVRLLGSGLFIAPPGRPAQLTVDGTSAVTINQAVANYGR
jgi:hypothetical protein